MPEFRAIPSIEQMRQRPAVRALEAQFGTDATVDALRAGAARVRQTMVAAASSETASDTTSGATTDTVAASIEAAATVQLQQAFRPSLRPVINASGVIVHTNLGRAPLADAAIDRITAVARGYCLLEYDLERGERGRRDVHAEALLCRLTTADAAVVVNNNAAATMIVLAALAAGREVIVSRGELVEIGGGFRVPDVLAQSGAILREVGTTNKTRAADYAAAISDRTALILRVHPSNFRIEGFTERPSLADLVEVGKKCHVPVAEDLGSGNLARVSETSETSETSDTGEPLVADSVAAGVDVCCFSGDKLLGGPQAGIIVGRTPMIERIRTHPLMRALRVDKMTYAALEATLAAYAAGRARETIPVQRMLAMTSADIRIRADALAARLTGRPGWRATLVAGVSAIGGGSAPGVELPTMLVAIDKTGLSPNALEAALRRLSPPIVARIDRDRLVLDLRTVLPHEDDLLLAALESL